jgi:hypothetical protein
MALYDSLIGFWKLNEASGTRLDSIGDNDLTDVNTVTSDTGLVYPLAAKFTQANNESLTHSSNATLQSGNIDFWVAAWVKFDSVADINVLMQKGRSFTVNEYEWTLYSTPSNVSLRVNNGSVNTELIFTGTTLTTGVWYLFIAYHDATNNFLGVSVNGSNFTTSAYSLGVVLTAEDFHLGRGQTDNLTRHHNGLIGSAMYGKGYIPTNADAAYLYNGGLGRIPNREYVTSTRSWVAPVGVSSVTAEAWGGGAGGSEWQPLAPRGGAGGGGGAYAASDLSVTPGSSYTATVGGGGTQGISGGDSSFSGDSASVVAKAGLSNGQSRTGGSGGSAASSTGTTRFSGGNGGNAADVVNSGGGGGGAAAGTNTDGASGQSSTSTSGTSGGVGTAGGGSGGAGGGAAQNGSHGSIPGGAGGGTGGQNVSQVAGNGARGEVRLYWTEPLPGFPEAFMHYQRRRA